MAGPERPAAAGGVVLVVDPDPDVRLLAMMRIRQLGWPAIGAATGEQAVRVVTDQPVVLLVVELELAGIDGWETLTKARQRAASPELPAIALTIVDRDPTDRDAQTVAAYLTKPFRAADLRTAVTDAIGTP